MAVTRRAGRFEDDAEWNAVWAEYDARLARRRAAVGAGIGAHHRPEPAGQDAEIPGGLTLARGGHCAPPRPPDHPLARSRPTAGRAAFGAALSVALIAGLWAALPWLLAMRVTAALRSPDPVALARQVEPAATVAGLREALLAEIPPGLDGAAGRWVRDLADRMAAAAESRGNAAEWLRLRAGSREVEGLPRLEVLRDLRAVGPARFRLDYGPERGPGGMRFDVAWQGGDFRIVGVQALDTPPRVLPERRPNRALVAMR